MANEFICSDCKGDGTRCDCHKKRPPAPYQTSAKDKLEMEMLGIEREWRKLGVNFKFHR